MRERWRKPAKLYEKLLKGKPRRLGQNAPLSRILKIKQKNARFLPAKTGVLYPIHVNTTQNVTLKVSNSALEGWLSYGTSTTADFTNVVFTKNNHTSYGMFRPYGTTVLTNCEFTNMEIDFGSLGENETITFIGCTINGVALKLSDLTIPAGKESLVTVK